MRLDPGRTALATIALAEIGAFAGAAVCWLFFVAWALYSYGPHVIAPQPLLGMTLGALVAGVPLGAVTLPLLGLGFLRRIPLWRALAFPALGAPIGIGIGAAMSAGSASLPVPLLAIVLGGAGIASGTGVARVAWSRILPHGERRLQP